MKNKLIAHKANVFFRRKNLVENFSLLTEIGVDILEIDVYQTKDNHFYISSDSRLYGKYFWNLKSNELIDLFSLESVIEHAILNNLTLMLDLKSFPAFYSFDIKKILKLLNQYDMNNHLNNFYIVSYDHNLINTIKKEFENINCGILFVGILTNYNILSDIGADFISTQTRFLTKKLINFIQKEKLMLCGWATTKSDDIDFLVKNNVSYLHCDTLEIIDYIKNNSIFAERYTNISKEFRDKLLKDIKYVKKYAK